MNENNSLRAFLAFLVVFSIMVLSQVATAASIATPVVAGYSAGSFSAAPGSFTTAANSASYGATGVVNVGGKAVTVPATLRMAANAGNIAKTAMRLNPWMLAGTLAAGYLADQYLSHDGDHWQTPAPVSGTYPYGKTWKNAYGATWGNTCGSSSQGCSADQAAAMGFQVVHAGNLTNISCAYGSGTQPSQTWICNADKPVNSTYPTGSQLLTITANNQPAAAFNPFPDSGWDGLPDPLPDVAPELPYAPYLPEGVPVEAPKYDFVPFSAPVGEPYTKPDGSTVQPMAKVSPNGDSVTIDTYDQPVTDPQGNPVPNPQPLDTPEPVPPTETQCEKFPASLGCANLDTPNAENLNTQARDVALITPVSIGSAGSCPAPMTADFLGQSLELSFDPLCTYANALRPLVLAIAWLSAGLIFIGGVRNG